MKTPELSYPLEILTRYLVNEEEYAAYGIDQHPNSKAAFEESNRLAEERIPQLREAVKILLANKQAQAYVDQQCKAEREKVLDDVINMLNEDVDNNYFEMYWTILKEQLESLKLKQP